MCMCEVCHFSISLSDLSDIAETSQRFRRDIAEMIPTRAIAGTFTLTPSLKQQQTRTPSRSHCHRGCDSGWLGYGRPPGTVAGQLAAVSDSA